MKTVIYMVRHAESPFIFGEERTRKLSKQVEMAAKRVTEILMDKVIDVMVSSSYTRAIQTIQELANHKGLRIKEYEELIERPIKSLDYRLTEPEIFEAIKLSFENKDYCLTGGETTFQARQRAIPIIMQLLLDYEGKSIVIGTHGNIMSIILNYFDKQYEYQFWKSTSKPDIYELVFNQTSLVEVKRVWDSEL